MTATVIVAYGFPLAPVVSLENLGRVLSASEEYLLAVVYNLRRERQKWAQISRLLGEEVADAQMLGRIYVAVVQAVLLYGS